MLRLWFSVDAGDVGLGSITLSPLMYSLIRDSKDVVALVDARARLLFANPAAERILGFAVTAYAGRTMLEYVHTDDLERVGMAFASAVTSPGLAVPIDFRMATVDKGYVWLEATANNLLDDPAVGGVVVNACDVTLRRRAERLVEEQSAILELIASNAPLEHSLGRIASLLESALDTPSAVFVCASDRSIHYATSPGLESRSIRDLGDALQRSVEGDRTVDWSLITNAQTYSCDDVGVLVLYDPEANKPGGANSAAILVATRLVVIAVGRARHTTTTWARPVLHLAEPDRDDAPVLRFAHLEIDRARSLVTLNGTRMNLTRTEYRLLETFAAAPRKLLTHQTLLRTVWGEGYGRETEYLRTFIAQLRRKLGDNAKNPQWIETVPRSGYRWLAEPDPPPPT